MEDSFFFLLQFSPYSSIFLIYFIYFIFPLQFSPYYLSSLNIFFSTSVIFLYLFSLFFFSTSLIPLSSLTSLCLHYASHFSYPLCSSPENPLFFISLNPFILFFLYLSSFFFSTPIISHSFLFFIFLLQYCPYSSFFLTSSLFLRHVFITPLIFLILCVFLQ